MHLSVVICLGGPGEARAAGNQATRKPVVASKPTPCQELAGQDDEVVGHCLLNLLASDEAQAKELLLRHIGGPGKLNHQKLLNVLLIATGAERFQLYPLVKQLYPNISRDSRTAVEDLIVAALCHPPLPETAITMEGICHELRRYRAPYAPSVIKYREPSPYSHLITPIAVTAVSLALTGLHLGLSIGLRDSTAGVGGFYCYQGILGGAALGLDAAAGLTKLVSLADSQPSAAGLITGFLSLVILPVTGAVVGGMVGLDQGRNPGDGRVISGVVFQSALLATALGWTWAFR